MELYNCQNCNKSIDYWGVYRSNEAIIVCRSCAFKVINLKKKGTFDFKELKEYDNIIADARKKVKEWLNYNRRYYNNETRGYKEIIDSIMSKEESKSLSLYGASRSCLSYEQFARVCEECLKDAKEQPDFEKINNSVLGAHKDFYNYYMLPYDYNIEY